MELAELVEIGKAHPGRMGECRAEGGGIYAVESFHFAGKFYRVDLNRRVCDCEDHCYRIAPARRIREMGYGCKHEQQALCFAVGETMKVALGIPRILLGMHLDRADLRPEQKIGIRMAMERQEEEEKSWKEQKPARRPRGPGKRRRSGGRNTWAAV